MEWKEWCKLCAKEKVHLLKVEAPKLSFKILNAIENYLQISFNFQDDCPSKICLSCVQMLVSFEKFLIKLNKAYSMFRELSDTACKIDDKIKLKYELIEEENEDERVILSLNSEVYEKEINRINAQENRPVKCEFIDIEDPKIIKSTLYQHLQIQNLNDKSILDKNSTLTSDDQDCHDELIADDFSEISEYENDDIDSLQNSREGTNKNIIEINHKNDSIKFVQKNHYERKKSNFVASESKPVKKYMTCEFCQKVFQLLAGPFSYFHHLKKEHNVIKTSVLPPCQYCGKVFFNSSNLKDHEMEHEMELFNKKLTCEICGFEVKNKKVLRKHKRMAHTTGLSLVCEVCGKSFKLREGLKEHLNKVHKFEPVKCDICNKEFQNPTRLRIHKTKYKNKKNKNFTCLDSKLRFHNSKEVPKKKPKECILCGKTFFFKNNDYRKHMITHLNLRPVQCRFCEKKCNDKSNARSHEICMHKKEYEAEKNKEMESRIKYKVDKCPPNNELIKMLQKLKNDGWSCPSSSSTKKRKRKVVKKENLNFDNFFSIF